MEANLEVNIMELFVMIYYIAKCCFRELRRGSVCINAAIYYKRYINTQELKDDGYIVIIRDGELVWNFATI